MKKLIINDVKDLSIEYFDDRKYLCMDFISQDINQHLNLESGSFFPIYGEFFAFSEEKKQIQSIFYMPNYVFDLSNKAYIKILNFLQEKNNEFFKLDVPINYDIVFETQKYDFDIIPIDYYHQISFSGMNNKLNKREIFNKIKFEPPIPFSKLNNFDNITTDVFFDYQNKLIYEPTDYKLVNARKIKDYCNFDNNTMLLFVNASNNVSSENYKLLEELKSLFPDFYLKLHTILSENNFYFDRLFFKITKNNDRFLFDGLFYHDGFNNLTFVEKYKIKYLGLNNNSKKGLLKLV